MPARICAYLNRYAGLGQFRLDNSGVDPELDALLIAFRVAEMTWNRAATGTARATTPELAASSEWLSTTQAAGQLHMTDRGIRTAIAAGRLKAESVAGRWRISREAFSHFRQTRN